MYDNARVIEVDIDEILPNRFQPRIQFDEEEILELSDSIKEHGVIQPLVVRTIGDKYEIIAGERRYKASVLAGKETVPVIVKNLNDKDSAEVALIENIQRKNLTPIEEALSYKKILDMGYITQENLASKLGKSQSSIANKIRLLNLTDEVQEALLENKISERHARSLLKLSEAKLQNEMLDRIISERLTVRRADEEIEKLKNNILPEGKEEYQNTIEKGEINMNNNLVGMPSVPPSPQPVEVPVLQPATPEVSQASSFDIFGGTAPAIPEVSQTPSFDIFGGTTPGQPTVSEVDPVISATPTPVVSEVPSIEPITPVAPVMPTMGGIQFDANGNVISDVSQTVVPEVPEAPQVTPVMPAVPEVQPTSVPAMPTMSGIQFDANGNVISDVSQTVVPEVPEAPQVTPVMPEVPQTAPIMESSIAESTPQVTKQSENLFSFGTAPVAPVVPEVQPVVPEVPTIPEFKMPEPIIITDYSKQYDPIMPTLPENTTPTVDFKEVINAIRECSSKIERYGFKIDVEEYDLANIYQVIFKIEK